MTQKYCANCFSQFVKRYNEELEQTRFTCSKCQYVTENVSEMITHHRGDCSGAQTGSLENDRAVLLLKLERMKNRFYRSVIENNTDIKLDEIILDSYDAIMFLNMKGSKYSDLVTELVGDNIKISISGTDVAKTVKVVEERGKKNKMAIGSSQEVALETRSHVEVTTKVQEKPVFEEVKTDTPVVEEGKTDTPVVEEDKKASPVKKTKYRTIKSCIDLSDEKTQEYWKEHVECEKKRRENDIASRFEDVKTSSQKISELLEAIGTNRIYNKYVKQLSGVRRNVCGFYTLSGYMGLLEEHNSRLTEVFKNKRMDDKKIANIVSSSLSAVEAKILKQGEYYKQYSEVDDMQSLAAILDNDIDSNEFFVPFDVNSVCENMHNYGTVIFSIKKTVERYLCNRYGFHNLIYLPISKSSIDDPYSFYTLTMIDDKKKRYWTMDCRLEDLSSSISNSLVLYLVNNFRALYKDIFGDNDYRDNYETFCQESTEDFAQLTMNIMLLSSGKRFCDVLRKIVVSNCTYSPSENDKFNIYGDDPLQRNRFKSQKDDEEEIISVIKQMFDVITPESAKEFYLYTQR